MNDATNDVLDGGTLPALLARRARQASDHRLATEAAAGLVLAAAVAVLQPPLWLPIGLAAACLGLFGAWGILDREAAEAPAGSRRARLLAAAKVLVSVAGTLSAIGFGLSFLASAIGPIIS